KGSLCQDRNGKVFTNRVCKSPQANALVRKSNEPVKGHPTCAQLLEASRLLERASDLYGEVGDVSGEVRDISRGTSWTEDRAKAGKGRGGKPGGLDEIKGAQRGPVRGGSPGSRGGGHGGWALRVSQRARTKSCRAARPPRRGAARLRAVCALLYLR